MADGPRLLVTGFEPFPGAPVNPTEWLMGKLRADPPALSGASAFAAEVLPVSYADVGLRLSEIGQRFRPDLAVHFGLALACRGFRLERVARNSFVPVQADNCGFVPVIGQICSGPEHLASSLPLDAIYAALSRAGVPVEWSDDAGGYLCNAVFTLSLARGVKGFEPAMSGFVHVPLVSVDFREEAFRAGVSIILQTCVDAYGEKEMARLASGHDDTAAESPLDQS